MSAAIERRIAALEAQHMARPTHYTTIKINEADNTPEKLPSIEAAGIAAYRQERGLSDDVDVSVILRIIVSPEARRKAALQ